jgi:hypothetical protein
MKKVRKQREPSAASIRAMPEVRFTRATAKPNPYFERYWAEQGVKPRRGRPKKGEESGPTHPRSIRFPDEVWSRLEAVARSQHLTVHAALRTAVLQWMGVMGKSRGQRTLRGVGEVRRQIEV